MDQRAKRPALLEATDTFSAWLSNPLIGLANFRLAGQNKQKNRWDQKDVTSRSDC
jgi:hypothetical protein